MVALVTQGEKATRPGVEAWARWIDLVRPYGATCNGMPLSSMTVSVWLEL
jgi:hypothetical protein